MESLGGDCPLLGGFVGVGRERAGEEKQSKSDTVWTLTDIALRRLTREAGEQPGVTQQVDAS